MTTVDMGSGHLLFSGPEGKGNRVDERSTPCSFFSANANEVGPDALLLDGGIVSGYRLRMSGSLATPSVSWRWLEAATIVTTLACENPLASIPIRVVGFWLTGTRAWIYCSDEAMDYDRIVPSHLPICFRPPTIPGLGILSLRGKLAGFLVDCPFSWIAEKSPLRESLILVAIEHLWLTTVRHPRAMTAARLRLERLLGELRHLISSDSPLCDAIGRSLSSEAFPDLLGRNVQG